MQLVLKTKKKKTRDKYVLYQASVQDPPADVEFYQRLWSDLRSKKARVMREDFCGTFALSCAWVTQTAGNRALSLDLDDEPLAYGKRHNLSRLTKEQQKRLKILKK